MNKANHIADSITKRKSWYWLAYESAMEAGATKSAPAFIELPHCNVCVWFASGDIEDTYADEITDNKGYSLTKHDGIWQKLQQSEEFQEILIAELKAIAEERQIERVA